MTVLKPFGSQSNFDSATFDSAAPNFAVEDHRHHQTRIRIRIPKEYQQDPIISNLISHHQLTVIISAALLGANGREDGWFDLNLQGPIPNIRSALIYLNDLDLEIWHENLDQQDGGW